MRGVGVLLGKEMLEITRTWRLWVLPAIMVFVGLSSPVLAKITPALLSSLTTDQPGLVIEIPDPVTIDAYLQFIKNATQLVLIAVIISVAGMIASEKRAGTAAIVLTKPVSRSAMVVAKVVSNWALLLGSTLLGAVLCVGMTTLLFDGGHVREFAVSVLLWLLLAAMYVACMAFFSVLIGSQGGAAGAGIGLYLALAILSVWGPGRDYTPAGLLSAGDRMMLGESVEVLWPVLTACGVAILATVAAAALFERQEL